MRHTEFLHPTLLAATVLLVITAALDAHFDLSKAAATSDTAFACLALTIAASDIDNTRACGPATDEAAPKRTHQP